jgi:hypothetical protein
VKLGKAAQDLVRRSYDMKAEEFAQAARASANRFDWYKIAQHLAKSVSMLDQALNRNAPETNKWGVYTFLLEPKQHSGSPDAMLMRTNKVRKDELVNYILDIAMMRLLEALVGGVVGNLTDQDLLEAADILLRRLLFHAEKASGLARHDYCVSLWPEGAPEKSIAKMTAQGDHQAVASVLFQNLRGFLNAVNTPEEHPQ